MRFTVAVLAALFSAVAIAETKPGLWEMTMKSDQLKQHQMPNMTPAQKEQMQKMGITIPAMRDGAMVQQVCITKEAAERMKTPGAPRESANECKLSNQNKSGNSFHADLTCDGPNVKGKGTVNGTFSGDTSYTSIYDFKGTSRGHDVNQHHETSAKWLGADCGNVKPMGEWVGAAQKK